MKSSVTKAVSADLVYTGNSDPIKNGIVEYDETGEIVFVGKAERYEGNSVEKLHGLLCPGFVNTHCHLELSHLKDKLDQQTGLPSFVQNIQKLRAVEIDLQMQAMESADKEMHKNGIMAVGDISNSSISFETKARSNLHYHTFVELFGFEKKKAEVIFEKGKEVVQELDNFKLSGNLTPHSPYSVSSELMKKIALSVEGKPMSIHNQETAEENRMFIEGKGKMMEMLQAFKSDISDWQPAKCSSIRSYLPDLRTNNKLLLVHNTFTSAEDMRWGERNHAQLYWCFCPNANLFIEGRLPEMDIFANADVKCTLGTDSLASNRGLSILEEMKTIQENFPQIPLRKLMEWATVNGAEFLGLDDRLGTLEKGKRPGLLHIKGVSDGYLKNTTVSRLA